MSAVEQLTEISTRHQVFLERLKAGEVKEFQAYLKRIDKEIRDRLSVGSLSEFQRARLEKLLKDIDQQLKLIFAEFEADLFERLKAVSEYEASFEVGALNSVIESPDFEAVLPAPTQTWAAVKAAPLSVRDNNGGKLLKPFVKDWTKKEREAVTGAIRRGFYEGQTNQQIIQAIRGTRANKYKDGLLAVTNRHAEAIVRTSVQHVASVARFQTWHANDDLVKGYQWVSTLDSRTTSQCRSLDGQVFKLKKGPKPPLHIRCRSTTAPVLDKRFSFLDEGATRSSAGDVKGYVDANQSYYDWLKKQSAKFQDEAIGPARGKLLREGGLTADRFRKLQLDKNLNPLTLDEMRKLEPLAFERAGI